MTSMQLRLFPATVYLLSGGTSSTLAAFYHRRKSVSDAIYYFNDTLIEDPDLYRFLVESIYFFKNKRISKKLAKLVRSIPELKPGVEISLRKSSLDQIFEIVHRETGLIRESSIDPWQAFRQEGYIGNTRVDVCSRLLKREPRQRFTKNIDCKICLGFSWSEIERYEKALIYENNLIAPLATDFVDTLALWEEFHDDSKIQKSRMYQMGFPHNNCGGMCVKAGLGQFRLLWEKKPAVYLWHEELMEKVISENPSLKPFLRKTVNGETRYLTLKQYRLEFLEKGEDSNVAPTGGCECAI